MVQGRGFDIPFNVRCIALDRPRTATSVDGALGGSQSRVGVVKDDRHGTGTVARVSSHHMIVHARSRELSVDIITRWRSSHCVHSQLHA